MSWREGVTRARLACCTQGNEQLYEGPCWITDLNAPLSKLPASSALLLQLRATVQARGMRRSEG